MQDAEKEGIMKQWMEWAKQLWAKSMMHRAMLVAPPVALVVVAAFGGIGGRGPVQYYTAKVEHGDISQVVQATGTINAVTTVQVGSQVSGTIAELFADFNSKVKKGQVIAQIDPAIFRTRLMQAEADVDNARANVKSLEAQTDTQRADVLASKAGVARAQAQLKEVSLQLNRTKELFQQGIASASQQDTAQANYDSNAAGLQVAEAQHEQSKARLKAMMAQMDQAHAQVSQRRAAMEMSSVDLSHTVIKAPIDGTVIARNVDVGQTVAASLSAPTLFVIAQDLTKMQVYAKTDEADVGKIKVEAMTDFRVDSFPRERFRGRVSQVRMNATSVQNVVTYDTIIAFENPEQKLFPGMTAYVTIPVAWANQVVKVPNGALRFQPDFPPDEKKALYEKHKIPVETASRRGMGGGGPSASLGTPGGPRGGNGAGPGGGMRGGEGPGGGEGAPRRISGPRVEQGVVWKLTRDKQLIPVSVKLGVTDFTFTELKEGELKPDDELVISQSNARSSSSGGGMPGQQRSPMGGPGGMPRRM